MNWKRTSESLDAVARAVWARKPRRLPPIFLTLLAAGFILLRSTPAQDRQTSNVMRSPTSDQPSLLPPPAQNKILSLEPDLNAPDAPDTYVIGKDDLLSISVFQMPELTRQVRVDASGSIQLPMLERPVAAEGITPPELAQHIGNELVRERLARAPQVQVMVRQVMSRPVVVAGAVKSPVVLQASRPLSLLEALSRAGGLDTDAGTTVLITQPAPAQSTERVNLADLLNADGSQADPILHGGETVRVLTANKVYAIGALKQPGAFDIQVGQPPTLLHTLALAQGVSQTEPADLKRAQILRTLPNGQREVIAVDLRQLLQHKKPDVALSPGDIVYVPENGRAKLFDSLFTDVGQAAVLAVGYGAR